MNRSIPIKSLTSFVAAVLLALPASVSAAKPKGNVTNPDFTKGESIPEGFKHDWNLGATGARGWIFTNKFATTDARQIKITKVAKGSPADGTLAVDDVILGVGGKPFSYDPRTEFGKALTAAESEAGGGKLVVTRWRGDRTEAVTVKLPVLGTYGATAPFACPKSKRIFDRGCAMLAKRVADPSYHPDAIIRSLYALALLASGKPEYRSMVSKEAQWAAGFSADSMATWYYGYVTMFLAEYKLATGACLLAYAVPLKSLWLTGKRPAKVPQLAAAAAEQLIRTSRGWTQGDLYSLYDKLSDDELLAALGKLVSDRARPRRDRTRPSQGSPGIPRAGLARRSVA